MKRRKFLKIFGAGTAVAFIGSLYLPGFKDAIRQILEEDTSSLLLEEDAIERFLTDAHSEKFWHHFSIPKKGFLQAHTLFAGNKVIGFPYKQKYNEYRNNIVGSFLLSTDFFINKMDPEKPIKYVVFHNPYKQPCSNPFSNYYYPTV